MTSENAGGMPTSMITLLAKPSSKQQRKGMSMTEGLQAEREWNRGIIEEFRENGGKLGGRFEGRPVLLLHHLGARSGVWRVNPLAYRAVDGAYAIFGSANGRENHPAWYHNVLAHPNVTVEVGTEEFEVVARVTEGEERDEIWERQKRQFPNFADYETRTSRRIPVVILEPATAA